MRVFPVPGQSYTSIDALAQGVLSSFQPEALAGEESVNIELLFEQFVPLHLEERYGVPFITEYTDLSSVGGPELLGFTDAKRGCAVVDSALVDSTSPIELRRGRSTIAHECGHCLVHVPVVRSFLSVISRDEAQLFRMKRTDLQAFVDPEWQAWAFARALLMPTQVVKLLQSQRRSERYLADFFSVNPAFVRSRLKDKTLR